MRGCAGEVEFRGNDSPDRRNAECHLPRWQEKPSLVATLSMDLKEAHAAVPYAIFYAKGVVHSYSLHASGTNIVKLIKI